MNELDQKTLAALDICSHYYPRAVIMPHGDTFVTVMWCVRCGEVGYTKYEDDDEEINDEPGELHESNY